MATELPYIEINLLVSKNNSMSKKHNKKNKDNSKVYFGHAPNSAVNQLVALKLQHGMMQHNAGQLDQAVITYEDILKIDPRHLDAMHSLAMLFVQTLEWDKALKFLTKSLTIDHSNASVHINRGNVLIELNRLEEALQSFICAIQFESSNYLAYFNCGVVLQGLKRFEEAITAYDQAINFKIDYAEAYSNRGIVLQEIKRFDEALVSYDQALNIIPNYAEAYSNRGIVLRLLKRFEVGLENFNKAIELNWNNAEAHFNRGIVLSELGLIDESIESYKNAIDVRCDYLEAYCNRGFLLKKLKRLDEARHNLEKAFALSPDHDYLLGNLLHLKMYMCDWEELENNIKKLTYGITEGAKSSISFAVLALTDSLLIQQRSAKTWVNDKYPPNISLGSIFKSIRKQKIKIGYYSADFREHAVSVLTAELFETHDKNNFEIYGFYFGPPDSSDAHRRASAAFDRFIDVRNTSDADAALISREIGVDIAVDLTGHTSDDRVGIFAYRAAPIQLSYIGYLGTMGAEYYDYLISDKIIIPEKSQRYYSEKIVYLPSYQVNDSKRKIADKVFTRAELNLPENAFVFCCFNNNYKITPPTFDGWMRILTAVPDSVLFLYADNNWAEINLKIEAEKRGVSPLRLVFGGRIESSEYLARYRSADLFLDTLPYNAGTTASDALWVGLPVLTCVGESFASRVAASLLNAIELPELITTTQEQYEATAIELGTNPLRLKAIRDKLERNRLTTALFDTASFTRHIESAYQHMYERYQADLPPDHIYIAA